MLITRPSPLHPDHYCIIKQRIRSQAEQDRLGNNDWIDGSSSAHAVGVLSSASTEQVQDSVVSYRARGTLCHNSAPRTKTGRNPAAGAADRSRIGSLLHRQLQRAENVAGKDA